MRTTKTIVSLVIVAALVLLLPGRVVRAISSIPPNVNISQRPGNESEEAIAVNPTNPNNIVMISNIQEGDAGLYKAVSFDGGLTWSGEIIADYDNLGDGCCDPSLSFDEYGNLFFTYLYNVENQIPVALSTDGGLTLSLFTNIVKPAGSNHNGAGSERGLFHWVDQPTIIAGNGAVWVVFNAGGPMYAVGAPVTGFGQVGEFSVREVVPGTNNCTYGDIAIGPSGQVMQVCSLTESGQGGGKVFVNLDPDGLGPAGFGQRIFVAQTHIGGFDYIPAQVDRSVDAETGLAWDRSGGPHSGRVFLVYTLEDKNESDNTDIYVRYSDDDGLTWSSAVRVNDDQTPNSQFLPKISLDQTSGNLAVVWYDARNDLGSGGAGDTNGIANDDAQFWGSYSTDGGLSFAPNFQISAGTSNSHLSQNRIDYGDYSGLSFYGGVAHPAWSDNSNSTGNNPDGTLFKLDIYTAAVTIPR